MQKSSCRVIISKSQQNLLYFLWRHRVSTFKTLKTLFFPNTGTETCYNRLRKLKKAGYVRLAYCERSGRTLWCLGERGFWHLEAVRLPELKTKSYRPNNIYHDWINMAALRGDWNERNPGGIAIVTDQELTATEVPWFPIGIQADIKHRPDGFWMKLNASEPTAIALEVEINGKSQARYEEICSAYNSIHFVDHVIWIVPDRGLSKKIQAAAEACVNSRTDFHLFVLLEDFEAGLWQAQILNGTGRKSMSQFLSSYFRMSDRIGIGTPIEKPVEDGQQSVRGPTKSPLLDSSLSIERFSGYKKIRKSPTSDSSICPPIHIDSPHQEPSSIHTKSPHSVQSIQRKNS